MATDLEPRHIHKWTDHDVSQALTVVALAGGHIERARTQLAEIGMDVSQRTLIRWKNESHVNRYKDICADVAPRVEAAVIDLQRELALRATTAALQAVDVEEQRIQSGEVKDAAGSARNLTTVAGIAVDKILSLTGRPTSVIEHRTADQSINRLASLGLVDSTATEIEDADVQETQALPSLQTAASV